MRKRSTPTIWAYLSPHLDDAVMSCGGLIWKQAHHGHDVVICTVFTASPPRQLSAFAQRFHSAWGIVGDPMKWRRMEDVESCSILGVRYLHLDFPDAAYRRSESAKGWLYKSDQTITGRIHPADAVLVLTKPSTSGGGPG